MVTGRFRGSTVHVIEIKNAAVADHPSAEEFKTGREQRTAFEVFCSCECNHKSSSPHRPQRAPGLTVWRRAFGFEFLNVVLEVLAIDPATPDADRQAVRL